MGNRGKLNICISLIASRSVMWRLKCTKFVFRRSWGAPDAPPDPSSAGEGKCQTSSTPKRLDASFSLSQGKLVPKA